MTFLEIRQRCAELMGVSSADTTADANATMETKLKEWVNARYRVLAAKRSWNWLIDDSIIQTVPDITTGTVTATLASTTITFTSAPASSVASYFIQFQGSTDWYQISTHTAAVTTAVMTVPYLGTTASGLTYTLRKVYYALPTDTGKILDIRQSRVWDTKLTYIPARSLDQYFAYRNAVATRPLFYSINGVDSSRQYKMEIFPIPSVAMNLNVRRYKVLAELSADGDVPSLPEAYHEILVWDTLGTYGYTFLDDTRLSSAKAESDRLYKDMVRNDVASENTAVRRPYDSGIGQSSDWLSDYNLPVS
jgi:hypothetical protein